MIDPRNELTKYSPKPNDEQRKADRLRAMWGLKVADDQRVLPV
jgi:hypothetical protein